MKMFLQTFMSALRGNLGKPAQILAGIDVVWMVLIVCLIVNEAAKRWL
jgi:hypothetical protein